MFSHKVKPAPEADSPDAAAFTPGSPNGEPAPRRVAEPGEDHGLILEPPPRRSVSRWERILRATGSRLDVVSRRMSSRPVLLAALCSVVAAVAMGWNLFGYPRLKEDEGITTFQALSFLHGNGASTLFTYGHVPGAPLTLAGWQRLLDVTGNFGGILDGLTTIERGRVLLVVLAVIQAPLIFFIVRRLTGLDLLATGASLLFSLSPLELWYGRWLEPDPFAGFWITMAIALAVPPVRGKGNLLRPILAGLALGAAIFSKEIAVVAAPGIGLMFLGWPRGRRWLAVPLVVLATAVIPGAFVAWLVGRNQFFASPGHASFIGLMTTQAGRQHDGGFLNPASHFWQVRDIWGNLQPFFIILSGFAAVWLTAFARTLARRGIGLMALLYWAFFASGIIVQDYYVASAVPLWVLACVIGPYDFVQRGFVQRRLWGFGLLARASGVATVIGLLLLAPAIPADALAFGAQDANIEADLTVWLRTHVPVQAAVVDDGTDTIDLRDSRLPGRNVANACNYYDTWCLHSPGVTIAYIVDNGLLNYLAEQDPNGAGALRRLALSGELVWAAEGLTDNNFIHVMRVSIPAPG